MIWWTFSRGGADPPTVVCAPRARRRQGRDLAEGRGEVGAVGEPQEQRVLAGLTAEGGAVARGHRVGEAQTLVDGHRQRPCSAGTDHVHAHASVNPCGGCASPGTRTPGRRVESTSSLRITARADSGTPMTSTSATPVTASVAPVRAAERLPRQPVHP